MSILYNNAEYKLNGQVAADGVQIALYAEPKAGKTKVTYPKGGDKDSGYLNGLAAQQLQAQVSKSVKPVYSIGTDNYYIIDGRPSGQGQISYLFGPSGAVVEAIETFANVCTPCCLQVKAGGGSGGCAASNSESIRYRNGTLTSFSTSATAQDFMVTGQIGFIFMDITKGS